MREIRRPAGAAHDLFLRTKLIPPRSHDNLVARGALWARLNAGLDSKLTLISAPAGSGKTTLISQWLATRSEPAAWLSLETSDSDPVRFWRYVVAACESFDADVGRNIYPLLERPQRDLAEVIPTALINALAQANGPFILALDDYHTITSQVIHDSLAYLIDHLPPSLHLILITRHDPPLPLARLRARDNLNEFRNDDLRLSRAEIGRFFEQSVHLSLPGETIDHLETRTEGWCAGLRLIALALLRREPQEVESFLESLGGTHRPILDYLVTDVLFAQPAEIQAFLLQTCFLKRLTGSLCDVVTGSANSAERLEELEAANVFLVALGGGWYRYHPLFAEAMQHYAQRQLNDADHHAQLERASTWYEQHGFLAEAVDAALDARAFSRAAALIEHLLADDFPNELVTLRGWIERLPEAILPDHPEIAFAYAAALLFTPERHLRPTLAAVDRPLRMAERRWEAEENHEQLGRVASLRAMTSMWQGDMPEAYHFAHEALRLIPESSPDLWRSSALILASREALDAGQLNAAQRFALEARALNEAARNPDGTRAATIIHGTICYEQGQLHQAFHLLQQILTQVQGGNQYEAISDRGYIFWGLGLVEFEWNDLEAAHQHAADAARIGKQIADIHLEVLATILLARIEHAQGRNKQAQHLLEALVSAAPPGDLLWSIQIWQAQLALAGGNLPLVELWRARRAWRQGTALSPALTAQETLLMARLQMLEGRPELALDDLEQCRAEAHAAGWTRAELEASLLIVQAHHLLGDAESARSLLNRALALAQPENIRRLFLDEGEPLAAAIHAALPEMTDKRLLTFARALLVDLAQTGHHAGSADALPDPLSAQEQRVLRLLAAGLSNGEIAQELVVSTNTIKSQLKSIYRKLNVSSREEAREAAHDFHLL